MSCLSGAWPIFLREMQIFRVRLSRPTYILSALVTPLMYLLVFGLGLGRQVRIEGGNYLAFLVPGLIGMAAMTNAFNWVASAINFSRFYYRTWPLIILAPVSPLAGVAGYVASGMARGGVAALLVGVAGFAAGWWPGSVSVLLLTLLLETVCFAALGVFIGVRTTRNEEHMVYANFLITPMGFFCGTFFPIDSLPLWLAVPMRFFPLTQANTALRQSAFGGEACLALGALAVFALTFFVLAVRAVRSYSE